jgi:hypothetical protein
MMEETINKKTNVGAFLLGVLLLAIGVLLLMSRAGVLNLNFERIIAYLVVVVGGFEAITAFSSSNNGRVFWGSALFLIGLLMVLISYDFVPSSWNQIWPSALIIPGLSFLMLYFSNMKESRVLIIAILFVASGWGGMLMVQGDFDLSDRVFGSMRFVVPAAVVLTGFYLVWRNFFRSKP